MNKSKGLFIATFLLLLAFMAAAQDGWKGTVDREGEVTVVRNPKEPLYKTPVLELEEELSLGGADAQGDYAFGQIQTFIVDDEGSIYVLDYKNVHIKVFDRAGKYVRTFDRKGQGPGELESPMYLSINRSLGELAVHQSRRRMSFFKADGTFLRHLSLKENWALRGRVDSKGNVHVTEYYDNLQDPHYELKRLGPDASVIGVLARSPLKGPGKLVDPFMPVAHWLLDRGDRVI